MNKKVLVFANIIVPLIIGAILYYIIAPDVIFVRVLSSFFNGDATSISQPETVFDYFVRYYLMDLLWGYALVFALYFCLDNNAAIVRIFIMAFLFSTAMELFQLMAIVPGVFDIWDIVIEGLAEAFAAFIIKNFF